MAPPAAVSACPAPSSTGRKRKQAQQQELAPPALNEYELQRQQRIERNRQIMQELGVEQAAAAVKQSMNASKKPKSGAKKKQKVLPEVPPAPSRHSSRLAAQPAIAEQLAQAALDQAENPEHASLLTQEEYFKLTDQEFAPAMKSDGSFKGWVCPKVCERYGIAGSSDEAWEANGGGKWSWKPDMSAVPAHLRGKGWSDAKAFAATMLRKSPNTYFYRHVAPHKTQAQGEWTAEEHELFMQTAKQFGVGDKWGLFASYIPQRVGYQCSAYYRDVVVAQGLIVDSRFRMTRCGKAVFVG